MENKFKDVSYAEVPKKVKNYDRFPRIVILIVVAEFCERFSFSGMRAFLAIYLKSKLHYSDDEATEIYHTFSTLVYFFPVFGAILADSYLGKFKTILYMMCVYGLGNVVIAVTAIPPLHIPARLFTMIGLLLIAVGTGGIKPCVAAFGGDQFKLPEQEKKLGLYFSVLYFNMAFAALVAKSVSPILRSEVQCYGDKDCYSLAFGGPGILMAFSIVLFGCASSYYVLKKPTGNVVLDVVRCISLGLKRKFITKASRAENSHWLDVTVDRYDPSFIEDIKRTLSVLVLYIPLPVFWALLDQLGSRWTLQASRMNGDFKYFTIKPDQMQVFCPIILLLIIPLFQKVLYPMLTACRILTNPLSKLTVGGILASLAFVCSGMLELYLQKTYPVLPQAGMSQLRIFNSVPCNVLIQNAELNISKIIEPFALYENKHIQVDGERRIVFELKSECVNFNESKLSQLYLEENVAVSYLLTEDLELNVNYRYIDTVAKSRSGYPLVRFLLTDDIDPSKVWFYNERRKELEVSNLPDFITQIYEVFTSNYTLYVNGTAQRRNVLIETGGVYTILIARDNNGTYVSKVLVVTEPNSVTMAWLLPQFLIISMGEVLFCVTGMEFTFKESPDSMKSVLQGSWLLTEAFGNLLIIAVTRFASHHTQATQSFIYSGLMVVAIAVFYIISRQFQFTRSMTVEVTEKRERKNRSNSEVLYLQVNQCEDCIDH